jgi:tetraacyldisaccharide 4'-kinase
LLDDEQRAAIQQEIRRYAPRVVWAEATHAPRVLESTAGQVQPLESLAGQPIAGFCGIGNPAGFRHALEHCGYRIAGMREFADHFPYPDSELSALADWCRGLNARAAICTGKDMVKIADRWPGPTVAR